MAEHSAGTPDGSRSPSQGGDAGAVVAPAPSASDAKRVAIYLVARDAVASLAGVLDRIPPKVAQRVDEILVFDSGSDDETYLVGMGYKAVSGRENLTLFRGERAGTGAHTKRAFDYCRERGYDILVLLHADGNYAPEVIEQFLEPLERAEVDCVIGNRLGDAAAARAGMPWYKRLGISVLGFWQRQVVPLAVQDHHCGYRAYSIPAIAELPYHENSDELHFDTELLIQMGLAGMRVAETPVPVYTGAESDSLGGIRYAWNVAHTLIELWLQRSGLREYPKFSITEKYAYKLSPDASHGRLLGLVERDQQRVLDVGCGAGYLAGALMQRGNRVTGVDVREVEGARERMEHFVQLDLDRGLVASLAAASGGDRPLYGLIVLADILEHLRAPDELLAECRELLAEGGKLLVSVPNVAHWSVRLQLLLGRFSYTARGILDRSHLRFYTLATIRQELERAGFEVELLTTTVAPVEELFDGRVLGASVRLWARIESLGTRFWPKLFGYQAVLRARKGSGA